jgi:hypothetical protein
MTAEETDGPETGLWEELLADARAIAEEYRDAGWDAVVLEPTAVSPVDRAERDGFDVEVSPEEYAVVENLVDEAGAAITAADVYHRSPAAGSDDRRVAIAVERDEDGETAVIVPLTYDVSASRSVLETALVEEELLVHVTADPDGEWVSFSHDDPSLFLEASDVRAWSDE